MKKIKVIIADDHPVMRSGVKSVLMTDPVIEIVGEAKDGEEAYNLIVKLQPDVALIDIEMPKMNGLEISRRVNSEKSKTRIVFLTMFKEEDMFNEAMDTGAYGYVLKENAVEDVVESVKLVAEGRNYISPTISGHLVSRLKSQNDLSKKLPSIKDLTKAERTVLKLISLEKTSQQIADELHISYKTVENHRNNISKKLKLHGTHSLLKFALNNKTLL